MEIQSLLDKIRIKLKYLELDINKLEQKLSEDNGGIKNEEIPYRDCGNNASNLECNEKRVGTGKERVKKV